MQIPKPTADDRERFMALIPDDRRVEVKPMFGNLGAFVNGNMFMGLFGDAIGVKLPDQDLGELSALPGSGPFGPAERPMGGYATLPAGLPADAVHMWVARSLDHIATMPAKRPKRAKR